MKNTLCVDKVHFCYHCKFNGFFVSTPQDGDFTRCPCCAKHDFLSDTLNYTNSPTEYDFLFEDEFENDIRIAFNYCNDCNIIFQLGCVHYKGPKGECGSNIFNCHFIKKWKHKVTNIEYEGMPKFDDKDDWFNNATNVEVLEMYCPHNNNKCSKGYPNDSVCEYKNKN
jgi:hypothetical protein